MKKINEKLIDIDLFVDIELKTDFRSQKSVLGRKYLKVSLPIKSQPQYIHYVQYVCMYVCMYMLYSLNTVLVQ